MGLDGGLAHEAFGHQDGTGKPLADMEIAKFTAWRLTPVAGHRGRLAPAWFEAQGRMGPRLVAELGRLAEMHATRHTLASPVFQSTMLADVLGRWRRRLSIALQRGNARVLRACLGSHRSVGTRGSAMDLIAA